MRYFIYFVAFIYLKVQVSSESPQNANLISTLNIKIHELKLKQMKEVITPNFRSKLMSFYEDEFYWKFASGISLFDQNFMMLDNDFYTFVDFDKLNISSTAKIIEGHSRVSIAKMNEFGNVAVMLLVVNKKEVRIIKFKKGEAEGFIFQEVQYIEHVSISDAHMFRNQNKLYMLIANDKGSNIAPVSLYEWTGDNFYEKQVIYTQGIPQIHSFEDNGRAIILMLHKRKGPTTICDVFEYEDQKMSKIQELKLEGPRHIIPYKMEDENYLLVLSAWKRHLYSWTGEKLVKISTESSNNNDYQKITLSKIKNVTLLFASKFHKFDVFMLSSQGAIYITTQEYLHKYTGLLSFDHFKFNETDYIFAVGNVGLMGEIEYYRIELTGVPKPEQTPPVADPLAICLSFLQGELEVESSNALKRPEKNSLRLRGSSSSMASYKLRAGNIEDIENLWFEEKIKDIDERSDDISNITENFKLDADQMEINGDVVIEGTLKGKELSAENLNVQMMNNKKWSPNQWLSYSKNQTIAGGKDANNLIVRELITTGEIDLLRDLLLNNSDVRISGSFTIDKLITDKLSVDEINNIKMDDIFMRGRDTIVKGIKSITNLTANNIEALNIEKPKMKTTPSIRFAPHVFIDDLEVDYIDGVEWKKFADSVFRYGISQEISGNVRMRTFDTKNLYVSSLNGIDANNFMTKKTDQTIDSILDIDQVHMKSNMVVNRINGLNPSEDIVTVKNPKVKGPVSIESLRIMGSLTLNYTNASSSEDQNIVGTKESDLVQNYHNEIKIVGNLRLKNFRNLNSLRIIVGEGQEEFNPNFPEKYWMKSVNQVVPVHVEARRGVRTPHLQTKFLNENGFSNFLLNNSETSLPANFDFENATFLGNIFLDDLKSHSPDLARIDVESVKNNGSFVIKGKKVFKDTLKIKSLITDELNGVKRKELVTKNKPVTFTGSKVFQNLVVNGNLISKTFSFNEVNGVDLENLKNNTIYIDRQQDIKNMSFTSISAENLNVESLNGRPINEYLAEVSDMLDIDVIDSLIINGKLAIGNLLGLSKINDKHPDVLFANRLKLDDKGVLHGNIRFLENVTIDHLSASFINNINFPELVNRIFYKSGNQTIPAKYTFKNLKTRNLLAPKINNHQIDPLVDIKSGEVQKIIAYKGAEFKHSSLTNLFADNLWPCDVVASFEAMKTPPTQTWSRITVHGNVTILDEENPLYDIFEHAVLLNEKNSIQAPVHFKNISAEDVETNEYINSVNLTHIFSDALLKKSEKEQVISGLNVIERLAVYSATVYNDSDITVVNGVDFPSIFNSVIPKGAIGMMPITGRKRFFAGLQTQKIQSKKVSNVIPEDLVTTDSAQKIRSVIFENIELKNLSVDNINNQDFHNFMNERVLLAGPPIQELQGFYSFYDVHINGNVEVPKINDVDMHDIVVDIHNQDIDSKKTFVNDLHIHGNVNIDMLNGRFISEIYEKAFLRNRKSYINQNVKILKPSFANGTIITESINGYSLEKMKRILNYETKINQQKEVNNMVYTMEKSNLRSYKLLEKKASEIMYIEKSNVIQLSFDNAMDAQVFRLKDYVLIHIIGEEDGSLCEMPKGCKCPVQHTIQISPENSINSFFSKGSQRVYSYDDKRMTAHLITNSVSTDATCRRNSSKSERSTLAWSTVTYQNNTGDMFTETLNFTGYVSDVEFFTINGATYAIIGKYYDPTTNSYDLDCVVYKFNEDRTAVTEIQRIDTHGVWNLKIFYTPQGVNLIVGMLGDELPSHNFEKTLFMRFNQDEEKFFLLRVVEAYGCSSAVGILLESESFIALTHKIHPVLIFKYDPLQDNYIYYQNLWDPSPIGGISLFYSGHYGRSDPYLCVTSKKGIYSIYTYEYIEGWQRKFFNEIEGLRNLVPFELNEKLYLFALSSNVSSVLTVVKYGSD
ncbi:uncharacterized protein LOC123322163 [Coccinella septempunctata]|uniref:uncharacterized protein LOC123322163 n=1 Tax=Coccinella septempunctata TaxID=41139 RepID=UPI001D087DE1|nr:uncharacterized protein LOC123322163 [Coccinella septempunctata]